jgi:hypothetical protein
VRRSVLVAYVLAAVFALIAVVALLARPIHYERTLALGLILRSPWRPSAIQEAAAFESARFKGRNLAPGTAAA